MGIGRESADFRWKKKCPPKKLNSPLKLECNGFTPSSKLAKLEDARLFYAVFTSYFC